MSTFLALREHRGEYEEDMDTCSDRNFERDDGGTSALGGKVLIGEKTCLSGVNTNNVFT